MLTCDLHTHSLFSDCGNHTILELLEWSCKKGIKGLAITDHGPKLFGRKISSTFFERLKNPYENKIKFFKGIEGNLLKDEGKTDIPRKFLKHMDIVLLGFHFIIPENLGADYYTDLLVKAMNENMFVDIITHPIDHKYPIHYEPVIETAKKTGMALEINNSKLELKIVTTKQQKDFLELCKAGGCRIAVNSDAHAINELGDDKHVRPLLEEVNYPKELIVNHDLESAMRFIEERRKFKLKA